MVDHDDRYGDELAAFVLGALSESEEAELDRHLAGCSECQDQLEQLRVTVGALPRSVEQLEAPQAVRKELFRTVRSEARAGARTATDPRPGLLERLGFVGGGLSPRFAGMAAALLVAVGVAAGFGITKATSGGGSSTTVLSAAVDRSRVPQASASLVVAPGGDGATLRVSGLPAPPAGHIYEVWLRRGTQVVPVSLFGVSADGTGAAAIPQGLRGSNLVMVTREVLGGALAPTEPPVISVRT